jgi:hypothetical protein
MNFSMLNLFKSLRILACLQLTILILLLAVSITFTVLGTRFRRLTMNISNEELAYPGGRERFAPPDDRALSLFARPGMLVSAHMSPTDVYDEDSYTPRNSVSDVPVK